MTIPIVDERTVDLHVNGAPWRQWRCTPVDIEPLAIGRLYIEGLISTADDAALHVDETADGGVLVHARIISEHHTHPQPANAAPIPQPETFTELFRALFRGVDARYEHGGMHATAATDGRAIVVQMEDVGRHNTIDKITGAVLLRGFSPGAFGLLTSSRVSGEIADKAVRAGFGWLASRSIPTTLAVQIAQRAHMPIIGRAASREPHVYQ